MAKKHRVKRANYVKHLLKVERERDAFLARRLKRNRNDRNEEDPMAEAREVMESAARAKKQRREEAPHGNDEAESEARAEEGRRATAEQIAAVATKGFFQASSAPAAATAAAAASAKDEDPEEKPKATARKTKRKY